MSGHCIELDDLLAQRRWAGQLDLSSRRRVLTDLAGTHLSGFRGRGMEFEEHRAYVAGDEIRSIDWRVTARTGQTHVRSYREERERPVIIAVDLRPPMWFGSQVCFKSVLAARAAALFAWAAAGNGDRVGGLCLAQGHGESRPAGGRRGPLRLIRLLTETPPPPATQTAPLSSLVEELRRLARPGAVILLLSDFHDLDAAARQGLLLLSRHCELILGMVFDPLERDPPAAGLYPCRENESGPVFRLSTRATADREGWRRAFSERQARWRDTALACRARGLQLSTDQPVASSFTQALGTRR